MEREKRRNEPAWIVGFGVETSKIFGRALWQTVCIRVNGNSELP